MRIIISCLLLCLLLFACSPSVDYGEPIAGGGYSTNKLLFWSMLVNESNSSRANDTAGFFANSQLNASLTGGISYNSTLQAYFFNGSGGNLTNGRPSADFNSTGHTYCVWLYLNSSGDGGTNYVVFGANKDSSNKVDNLLLNGAGKAIYTSYDNVSGQADFSNSSAKIFNSETWSQLCSAVNQSNKSVRLYINGVEVSFGQGANKDFHTTGSNPDFFAGSRRGTGEFFNGYIGKIEVWNTTLTPAEINQSFNNGRWKNNTLDLWQQKNLFLWYRSNAAPANSTIMVDSSGTYHDGVINATYNPTLKLFDINGSGGVNGSRWSNALNLSLYDATTLGRGIASSVWFRYDTVQAGTFPRIFSLYDHGTTGVNRYNYACLISVASDVLTCERNGGSTAFTININKTILPPNVTHNIGIRRYNNVDYVFVNGRYFKSITDNNIVVYNASILPSIVLGNRQSMLAPLNGSVGEFKFWYTNLSDDLFYDNYRRGIDDGDWVETIIVNNNNVTGTINNHLYGVNTHGTWDRGIGASIDTDADCSLDSTSNTSWHREKMLEAGIVVGRVDDGLENKYYALGNLGAEQYYSSALSINYSPSQGYNSTQQIPYLWNKGGAGNPYGKYERSTASFNGTYSINISSFNGSLYLYQDVSSNMFDVNSAYNFSVWTYSNATGTMILSVKKSDFSFTYCASPSNSVVLGWQQLSCSFNYTNTTTNIRFIIENQASSGTSKNGLWDDARLYINGTTTVPRHYNSTTFESLQNLTEWYYNTNRTVIHIISYMPSVLSRMNISCETNTQRCMPVNMTDYASLVVDAINYSTNNGRYLNNTLWEFWNEPDGKSFWNSSNNEQERLQDYITLYNATYNAAKNAYPNIVFGGPALASIDPSENSGQGNNLSRLFFQQLGGKYDFFSLHRYPNFGQPFESMKVENDRYFKILYSMCSLYGGNCSRIYYDEWNNGDTSAKANSSLLNKYGVELFDSYVGFAYNYPNISTAMYQWSETYSYSNNGATCRAAKEWPQKWEMVSDPSIENATYTSFNITKRMSTYHPVGSTIIGKTGTSEQPVLITRGNRSFITVAQREDTLKNLSLSFVGGSPTVLQNVETMVNYTINNSAVTLPLLNRYDLVTYEILGGNVTNISLCSGATFKFVPQLSTNYTNKLINYTTVSGGTAYAGCTLLANANNEAYPVGIMAKVNATDGGLHVVQLNGYNLTTSYQRVDTVPAASTKRYNLTGIWNNANATFIPVRLSIKYVGEA